MPLQCLTRVKLTSRGKNPVLPIEKFPFLALARNTMLHLIIHFVLHYLSSGPFREVKKMKISNFLF